MILTVALMPGHILRKPFRLRLEVAANRAVPVLEVLI